MLHRENGRNLQEKNIQTLFKGIEPFRGNGAHNCVKYSGVAAFKCIIHHVCEVFIWCYNICIMTQPCNL